MILLVFGRSSLKQTARDRRRAERRERRAIRRRQRRCWWTFPLGHEWVNFAEPPEQDVRCVECGMSCTGR